MAKNAIYRNWQPSEYALRQRVRMHSQTMSFTLLPSNPPKRNHNEPPSRNRNGSTFSDTWTIRALALALFFGSSGDSPNEHEAEAQLSPNERITLMGKYSETNRWKWTPWPPG